MINNTTTSLFIKIEAAQVPPEHEGAAPTVIWACAGLPLF